MHAGYQAPYRSGRGWFPSAMTVLISLILRSKVQPTLILHQGMWRLRVCMCVYVCICVCLCVYYTLRWRLHFTLDSTLEYPAAPLTPPGATALNAYHHPWVAEKYFRIRFFSELQNANFFDKQD